MMTDSKSHSNCTFSGKAVIFTYWPTYNEQISQVDLWCDQQMDFATTENTESNQMG